MLESSGQKFSYLDRLATLNLSSYETRVLLSVLKWHLVYNNGGVIISLSRIIKSTNLSQPHVCRAFRGLIQKQVLYKTSKNGLPFYSFTVPIKGVPIQAQGVPIQAINMPIKAQVISTSNKELNNNIDASQEKNFKTFWETYPKPKSGSWYESIEKRCRAIFNDLDPDDQSKIIEAIKAYKKSKSVQDGKVLSPINFLNSPKIVAQYSEEAAPKKPRINETSENIKKWKDEQEKDPPKGSLKESFDKLVGATAETKGVNKKGRG